MRYKVLLISIFFIGFSTFSTRANAQEYTPGWACGHTQPNAQMWGNCAGNAGPSCQTDPTQGTQWGWFSGNNITNQNYKTSPSNPLWMQVQCFVELSFGPGGMNPATVRIVDSNGNTVSSLSRPWGNNTALVTTLPNPGTYRAECLTPSGCLASYDTFTIYPRVPPCTPSNPVAAVLTSPVNNQTLLLGVNNSVSFAYTVNNGWGTGCPQNNSYDLQLDLDCDGGWQSFNQLSQINNLLKGRTYCWRVRKSNGSNAIQSEVRRFTTIDDTVTLTGSGVAADVCGIGFSGRSGVSGVSNPIDYNLSFSSASGNTYTEVWLAAVPDSDPFNNCTTAGGNMNVPACNNQESADPVSESSLLGKVANSSSFAFKIILNAAGTPIQYQGYSGVSGWITAPAGTDVNSFGATLVSSGTNASVSAQNLTSNFRVRFNTTGLGKYRFYGATLIRDAIGNLKTSFHSTASQRVYKRLTANATRANWGVDLNPPVAVSGFRVNYVTANNFTTNWQFNDVNGVQFRSFVSRDISGSTLTENSGAIDFNILPPDQAQFKNGTLRLQNIGSGNAYVRDGVAPTLRSYTDSDPNLQTNYQMHSYVRDNACNQDVISISASLQKPWVLSYDGNISASQGIVGISIPSGLNSFSEDLRSSVGNILTDRNSVYLSTYGAISGTADMPIRKQSKYGQFNLNYKDLSIKPPQDSGTTSWYSYIDKLVQENNKATISAVGNTLNGTTSGYLSVAAGSKRHARVAGTLTVNAGSTCDTQTIIFADSLVLNPNFRVNGNRNGCLFVVRGDVTITNGSRVTAAGTTLDSTTLSVYDLIEAGIISDGSLLTSKDVSIATEKGDGLTIRGSVVSNGITMGRDINLNANQFQPAYVFYYDGRYRQIFKEDLDYKQYSIREVGF